MKGKLTLIELIVVIVSLSIIALIIILNINPLKKDAIQAAHSVNESMLQTAVDRYYLDNNEYPIDNPDSEMIQLVDYNNLYPKYIKKIPKQDFWLNGTEVSYTEPSIASPDLPIDITEVETCEEAVKTGYDKCIKTPQELDDIRNNKTLRYIVLNDIDLTPFKNWTPIQGMTGELNGNGKKITNLNLDSISQNVGLFSTLNGAVVQNLYIKNANISGKGRFGVLAGSISNNSVISNVVVDGKLIGDGNYIGGIVGLSENSELKNLKSLVNIKANEGRYHGGVFGFSETNTRLENIQYRGIISSNGSSVGGIGGLMRGNGTDLSSMVELSNIGPYAGGLLGEAYGQLVNSESHGKVISEGNSVGGLIGCGYAFILKVHSTASVSGNSLVGGLIGEGDFGINGIEEGGYSYATGNVSGKGDFVGGLVGQYNGKSVSKIYALGNVTSKGNYTGGLIGMNNGTSLKEVFAKGKVHSTGSYTGGLIGQNNGTLTLSYSHGTVTSDSNYAGGLIGQNNRPVSESFSTSRVEIKGDFVGGLIGENTGNLLNVYSTGNVYAEANYYDRQIEHEIITAAGGLIGINNRTIQNAYSIGVVKSNKGYAGGLIGLSTSTASDYSSFWDLETSNINTSSGGTPKISIDMKKQSTYTGWDFNNIWSIEEGNKYPILKSLE